MSLDSKDVVDTSSRNEVILVIDTTRLRRQVAIDARFDRVVRDLVLGVPVAGCELDEWGIQALGIGTLEEIEAQADLFEHSVQ